MNVQKIVGHGVTHISWGAGIITEADEKYVSVEFSEGGVKKYQFPKAFTAFLVIDDPLLQAEILEEERILAERIKQEKAIASSQKALAEKEKVQIARKDGSKRSSSSLGGSIKDVKFEGHILEPGISFSTHAEALNKCFGFKYKQYQQAYKDLGAGYAVWFPSIAKEAWGEYISTDSFSGWVNILSEDQNTLLQVDNDIYGISEKNYDPNKRIVFAKFDRDKRYRFIGVYGREQRTNNGFEYTRMGNKLDTMTMRILDD